MEKYHDKEIKFSTRGDDIERLNEAIKLVHNNELLVSYLCYLKFEIIEQLDIELPKEEYPIGHEKGLTYEEFDKWLESS